MTSRTWLYDQMSNSGHMTALVDDRIFQSTSIDVAPKTFPFIMYRQTSDVERFRGDDTDSVRSIGYMIFAHDVPGDYMQIDSLMDVLKELFRDTYDQAAGVVRCRLGEISDDLRDDDMGTITKFARVQVLYKY